MDINDAQDKLYKPSQINTPNALYNTQQINGINRNDNNYDNNSMIILNNIKEITNNPYNYSRYNQALLNEVFNNPEEEIILILMKLTKMKKRITLHHQNKTYETT